MKRSLWLAAIVLTACGGAAKQSALPTTEPAPVESTEPAATGAGEDALAPPVKEDDAEKSVGMPPSVDQGGPAPVEAPSQVQPKSTRAPSKGSPAPGGGGPTKKHADPCEGGE